MDPYQLGSLIFALSYKNDRNLPWSSPLVWAPLISFVVSAIAFGLVEAFWSPEPVMPLRLLKTRNAFFVALTNLTLSWVSFSILYFYPLFFEIVKQNSASRAGELRRAMVVPLSAGNGLIRARWTPRTGAHLLPNSIALSVGSLFAGWVSPATLLTDDPSC